ncbi:MAG: sodium:solute symporter family protein [Synergistaceae bacterium]|nr:sodium:solute symporter family protein [Synergistaceae bacterium]
MFYFYLAAISILAIFAATGTFIGTRRSATKDYSLGGRRSSAAGVTGILLGALVGGASTVGTVQMAYSYGMTAIWFTLGGGLGCLLLGLRFAVPLRNSNITTVADYLAQSYGGKESFCGKSMSLTATLSSTIGTFISISAQFLSCIALLRGLFPISSPTASLLAGLSIIAFIAAGGLKSFSTLGGAKIILLYFVLLSCFTMAIIKGGTFSFVTTQLGAVPWFSPFGRGFVHEIGYLVSMIVGVFTTQIYIQSLAAAKDAQTAKRGAFASAVLMPPMGLLGVWIGLSVRARGIEVRPEEVLSWFIRDSFPPFLGGIIWGGILITVIGCASGLILGISTNIVKNLVPENFLQKYKDKEIVMHRLLIGAIVISAALTGITGTGSMILEWSYLSMGLRGAGTFLPFAAAVMRPHALSPGWALASSVTGLSGTIVWGIAALPGDPLFAGLALSASCVIIGIKSKKQYV